MELDPGICQDSERDEIRSELSKMSFEELQKLKGKLGEKVYNEAIFGVKNVGTRQFKRENKNRPREVSSKLKPVQKTTKQKRITDPRFDRLCGTFNEKHFRNTYEFLTNMKKQEKTELKKLLKVEKNPKEINKIRYLIQRMENQERETVKKLKKQETDKREKEEKMEALKSGEKPYFRTKYERKIVDLAGKYSDLKKTGKVEKFIKKKQKKLNMKERKKRFSDVNVEDGEI